MITFNTVYDLLKDNGYEVTKEPEEQKPPNKIEMKFDMRVDVEDIGMTSYRVDNFIDLNWVTNDPGAIQAQVTKLLKLLGSAYHEENLFRMELQPLKRAKAAMYEIVVTIQWPIWIDISIA